jgi:hypothetical protein
MQRALRSTLTSSRELSHASNLARGTGRNFSSTAVNNKQRVVILGSGWGGYGLLRGIDKERYGIFRTLSVDEHYRSLNKNRRRGRLAKYVF